MSEVTTAKRAMCSTGKQGPSPTAAQHNNPRVQPLHTPVNVLVTVQQHLRLNNGHQASVLGNGGVAGQAVGAVAQGNLAGACVGGRVAEKTGTW
jgi:hypothetical protein